MTPLILGLAGILALGGWNAAPFSARAEGAAVTLTVQAQGKAISPDLFGIFFEDINYAADGGLYGELIQNGSFEYQATEQAGWNPLSFWEVAVQGAGKGSMVVETADPICENNPHYCVLEVAQPGDGVGLANGGFDGIAVQAGENYLVSVFAKQVYVGGRWNAEKGGQPAPLKARLESKDGRNLGCVMLAAPGWDWTRLTGTITASNTDNAARLVLLARQRGGVGVDMVSLFPQKTFHNRPNGLRPDLAQAVAELQPKFIRFPGGCVAHGNGLGNMYRWKDTIGPVEQRRGQANLWGYHQSVGLGYFEYFQFCEDIGAKPLPVVAAGVSCQNSGHTGGTGQRGLPLDAMPGYVQEVLDLVEWANGPADSTWGAKRAAAGHPASFHLQYLGVGNEDAQTEVFRERFKLIHDAVKAKHPEITVIGTVGPAPDDTDYEAGWKFANGQRLEMVDEHGYESPEWFWSNLARYDRYDRNGSKVYLGEYAAHEAGRVNTLRSALAEAAYMTSLERNGDVVRLASYAPLLGKQGHMQWHPDMIYFDNTQVVRTVNYYAQQLFARNQGDRSLPVAAEGMAAVTNLAVSCVQSSATGDVIFKIVNGSTNGVQAQINVSQLGEVQAEAARTVLAGDEKAVNSQAHPDEVIPVAARLAAGKSFAYAIPPSSLSVIRLALAHSAADH